MKNRLRLAILITPPAVWILLLFVIPVGIMAVYSFRSGSFGAASQQFSLAALNTFLQNRSYQGLLFESTFLAAETAILSVILAYPIAYFLVFRVGRMRMVLLTLLIAPAWTSYLLRILSWKIILGNNGLLNNLLISAGITSEALPALLYNRTAVVITLVYVWIPFAVLPIFSALERIDKRLLEASADLGSPFWETFLRVTLPLSMPGVASAFFFVFIPTIGEWVTPSLVGGAQGIMYGNLIQDQFVRALNWPLGALMSMVMLVLVLLLTFIITRFVKITEYSGY